MPYKNGVYDELLNINLTLVWTDAVTCTTEDHRLFKKISTHGSLGR